ncbi:MAG: RlpA-like double-psi beta-barrel domain-containing protein, partial [Hyphomicrobium sp.]
MRTRRSNCAQAFRHLWYRVLAPFSFVLLLCAMSALPLRAKIPGKMHCHRDVCHRVMTIAETERLIGSTRTVFTTYYDDPSVDRFNRGEFTSSGEKFDANNPARAASSTFPDGTELLVWNPNNGRAGHVRINDFGPFHTNRTLDVTRALAEYLDMKRTGVVALRVTVIVAPHRGEPRYRQNRTFQGAKGYLGTYDEYEVTELARELVVGAQSARRAKPLNGAHMASIPIPLQKPLARSGPQVAAVALLVGQSIGDAKLRRSPGDEIGVPVEDPVQVMGAGVERVRQAERVGPGVPPPAVTDQLLSPPPPNVTDRLLSPLPAIASAPVVQGQAIPVWRG